jgi:formate/nitrite transporter FocA (FNT family)
MGKQQLFTENTLIPILPLLHRKDVKTFVNVLRLWSIVLLANMLGVLVVSFVSARTMIFDPDVQKAFEQLGLKAIEPSFETTFLRGIMAGWLIALMVWILPYAKSAKMWVIIIITYIVGVGHFSHVIAGAVEVFTLAFMQQASWGTVLINYLVPTLFGNVLGGVVIVAALNHAQIVGTD